MRPGNTSRRSMAIAVSIASIGCGRAIADRSTQPQLSDAALLRSAVQQLSNVIVYDIFSPPQASRVYTYASVAAYEALRPSHPGYKTLAGQLNGLTELPAAPTEDYSPALAGVHAFMSVGKQLTFSRERMDSLRTALDDQF